MVGCLGKLYGNLENLNDTYLQPNLNKDVLLKPKKLPMPIGGPHQLLPALTDGESNVAAGGKGGGFVREAVTYMITDDLEVKPMSAISIIALLKTSMLGMFVHLKRLWFLDKDKGLKLLKGIVAVKCSSDECVPLSSISSSHFEASFGIANLPEPLRQESSGNSILELSLDADYPTEGHEAATEACCHFWTRVLQRFASAKTQEASELKVMMENLVTVLLTTLNLPEYPASAPILQVTCVLLLQNAGLKSKDIGARTRAIDLLGTIAARLKRDSALGSKDKFWMLQELVVRKCFMLIAWESQCKDDGTKDRNRSGRTTEVAFSITKLEASLMENSPVIRAKALRAVSIIVEADLQVLGDKRVQSAVEGRFCDSAISVREAALELVGRHIASHPDVAERIKDTGVSVRKRSIKIIRDVCVSNANFSEFTKACIAIISRTGDDESSIKDIVCKTFYEFWFEEPTGSQTQFFGDGSSVPLEVAKKTEQIVEMLRRMPSHQLLVTVIKSNLALDFFPNQLKLPCLTCICTQAL
ncbi:unnamed protein product [Prunus armeniaca]|uniref:Uncharacterized protein n=1 Tax=Prunus armeniaca TaxID=36596 RepID=A0A6J5X726_PRUAR|nr:unnamed protein product [Prunus armeniaca]